jgi:branched-chain amino acid transport system permease protein
VSVSSAGCEPGGAPTLLARPLRWLGDGVNLPLTLGALAFVVYANRAGGYELAGAYAILVIGYQFIFSYAGAASLAQSCFFGLGAYVTGVLGATYGLGSEITLPLSILAPGLLAAAVAGAVLRLEDHYFSLATLAITLLVTLVVTQWLSVTGGTNGLSGIPSFSLFGQTVASRYDTMLLVWAFVVAAALLALLILRGLYGRAFHLMRESRPVASALGLDTARMRFSAFVLSGCYGGWRARLWRM